MVARAIEFEKPTVAASANLETEPDPGQTIAYLMRTTTGMQRTRGGLRFYPEWRVYLKDDEAGHAIVTDEMLSDRFLIYTELTVIPAGYTCEGFEAPHQ